MAGKNIYIEKILDNLLGGIDTAIASMKEAIYKMIGGEDPEIQKSLPDVVAGLSGVVDKLAENQAATAEMIEGVTEKLDEQIDELERVVKASSQSVNVLNITGNQDEISDYVTLLNSPLGAHTKNYTFRSFSNGAIRVCKNKNATTWHKNAGQWMGEGVGFTFTVSDAEGNSIVTYGTSSVYYDLSVEGNDTIDFTFEVNQNKTYIIKMVCRYNTGYGGTVDNLTEDYYALQYGIKNITEQGGAIEILNIA